MDVTFRSHAVQLISVSSLSFPLHCVCNQAVQLTTGTHHKGSHMQKYTSLGAGVGLLFVFFHSLQNTIISEVLITIIFYQKIFNFKIDFAMKIKEITGWSEFLNAFIVQTLSVFMYLYRMHFKNVYRKAVTVTNEIVKVINLRIGILYVPIECLNYDLVRLDILKTVPCLVPL